MLHELRHIRAFLQVAQTRNFTRAAHDLHVSQSALTVQIKQLEERLGFPLFDRGKRGVTLTASGEEVLAPLQRLLEDAEAIINSAQNLSSARSGSVTIAALPTVSAGLLPRVLEGFAKKHAGIRVTILDVVAERAREAVLKRQADLGIGTLPSRHEELQAVPLYRDRLVLFVPAGHELAKREAVTLKEACSYDLILPVRDSSVRETVAAIAHRERLVIRPRCETNFMPTALALTRHKLGLAILPESAAGPEMSDLVKIPFDSKAFSRQIQLFSRTDRGFSPAATAFVSYLRTFLDQAGETSEARPARRPSSSRVPIKRH